MFKLEKEYFSRMQIIMFRMMCGCKTWSPAITEQYVVNPAANLKQSSGNYFFLTKMN
jgi:hypothetical protein